ncbi:hypothetical protein P9112_013152 [Eukaryota sp. TZLM1-RC]
MSLLYSHTSDYLTVNSLDLHTERWIPANKAVRDCTLVLLNHGMFGNTYNWRFLGPFLAEKGFFVLAIDMVGFGLSCRCTNFVHGHDDRARLLWGVIQHVEQEYSISDTLKWVIIAHSMGCASAIMMKKEKEHKIERLIFIAPALQPVIPPVAKFICSLRPLRPLIYPITKAVLKRRSRFERSLIKAYGRVPTEEEIEGHFTPLQMPETHKCLVKMMATQSEDIGVDLIRSIGDLPILIIWGDKDAVVPLEEGRWLEELLNTSIVVIEGEGHCPAETNPEETNHIIWDWLSKTP